MNEQIERFIESCQEFINALCDIVNDIVDKIERFIEEVNWSELVTRYVENIKADVNLESKKAQEQISRRIFEMQMKHYRYDDYFKFVQMNKRTAPKNWTGKNFKKVV